MRYVPSALQRKAHTAQSFTKAPAPAAIKLVNE